MLYSPTVRHCVLQAMIPNPAGCSYKIMSWSASQIMQPDRLASVSMRLMGACGPVQDTIAKALVRGLQTCPDVVPMRKELLVATRHGLLQLKSCACQLALLLPSHRFALALVNHSTATAGGHALLATLAFAIHL